MYGLPLGRQPQSSFRRRLDLPVVVFESESSSEEGPVRRRAQGVTLWSAKAQVPPIAACPALGVAADRMRWEVLVLGPGHPGADGGGKERDDRHGMEPVVHGATARATAGGSSNSPPIGACSSPRGPSTEVP